MNSLLHPADMQWFVNAPFSCIPKMEHGTFPAPQDPSTPFLTYPFTSASTLSAQQLHLPGYGDAGHWLSSWNASVNPNPNQDGLILDFQSFSKWMCAHARFSQRSFSLWKTININSIQRHQTGDRESAKSRSRNTTAKPDLGWLQPHACFSSTHTHNTGYQKSKHSVFTGLLL